MKIWLVKRQCDKVIVTIMKNKSDETYSFINLTKEHIPVIALDENNIYEELHPWLQCCISRHENTIHDLTEYIMNFYVN